MDQDIYRQLVKQLEENGQKMARMIEKRLERQRTKKIVMVYSLIFLPVAWLVTEPMWSWGVLVVGLADWIVCKVFRPIRVQLMGMTVQEIEHDDNS